MSRSPRKNLRRSVEALSDVLDVLDQHPEARGDFTAVIGDTGLHDLRRAHRELRALLERLDASPPIAPSR